jgi:hypothetical protein
VSPSRPLTLAALLLVGAAQAQSPPEARILVPGGGANGYTAVPLPGSRQGERVEVGRNAVGTPATGQASGLYGRNGERLGTVRTTPWGGTAVYGKDGRRLD